MPTEKRRHTPVRMCIVCRQRFSKAQLSRHTRSPQGRWMSDEKQTQPGRGWYVCSGLGCRERFAKGYASGRKNGRSSSKQRQG